MAHVVPMAQEALAGSRPNTTSPDWRVSMRRAGGMLTNRPVAAEGWVASVNQPATSAMRCVAWLANKLILPPAPIGTITRLARDSTGPRLRLDAFGLG